jgi:membrane protein DedA with SNARE-associated domain
MAEIANTALLSFLVFVCVTTTWAGVPFIGAVAAGAAGVAAAADGQLSIAGAVIVVAIAGEIGGIAGYEIGLRWGRELVERPGKHQASSTLHGGTASMTGFTGRLGAPRGPGRLRVPTREYR